MDKKELNFSAPLLSVRRISSPRNTPERDYRELKKGLPHTKQHLPPTNKSNLKQDQDNEPGAVPFVWEYTPGRPKGHSGPLCVPRKNPSIIPKLPPGRVSKILCPPVRKQTEDQHYAHTSRNEVFSVNEGLTRWQSSRVSMEGVSESGEDVYSDAPDTLSTGESCSWSCDVSGLSGSDGPDTKPSGTFLTDPLIQDFIMKRFLPAAKAMTLDTPQYVSRKLLARPESPGPVIKEIPGDELNVLPSRSLSMMEEVSDDEGNHSCDDSVGNIVKACGLVPRFPFRKNSLCLMNPVPGMRYTIPSSKSALNRNKNANKFPWNPDRTHKNIDGAESFDPCSLENKVTAKSCQLDYRRNLLEKNHSFPINHTRGGCISPYRDQAPRSPFPGKGFLGLPKMVENSKYDRLPHNQKRNYSSDSGSPVIEKTLYIDSITTVKTQHLSPSCSDTKKPISFDDETFKELEENKNMEEISMVDSKSISIADFRSEGGNIVEQTFSRNSSLCNEQSVGSEYEGDSMAISIPSPLPPPLPKSPSESWLKRALPKISFRKKAPVVTEPPASAKWENIVKASKLHRDHLRYSEELITGASQQPKP